MNGAAAKAVDDGTDGGVINEGIEGKSKQKFLMEDANGSNQLSNEDKKYDGSNSQIPGSDDQEDKRDSVT